MIRKHYSTLNDDFYFINSEYEENIILNKIMKDVGYFWLYLLHVIVTLYVLFIFYKIGDAYFFNKKEQQQQRHFQIVTLGLKRDETDKICSFCNQDIDGSIYRMKRCNHSFHKKCLTELVKKNIRCPKCCIV
jgi:hypothetical protein